MGGAESKHWEIELEGAEIPDYFHLHRRKKVSQGYINFDFTKTLGTILLRFKKLSN